MKQMAKELHIDKTLGLQLRMFMAIMLMMGVHGDDIDNHGNDVDVHEFKRFCITNPQSQILMVMMLMLMLALDMATLRVLEMVTKMAMATVMMMSMEIWDGDGDYVDYGDNALGNSVHQRRQGKKTHAWSCTLTPQKLVASHYSCGDGHEFFIDRTDTRPLRGLRRDAFQSEVECFLHAVKEFLIAFASAHKHWIKAIICPALTGKKTHPICEINSS